MLKVEDICFEDLTEYQKSDQPSNGCGAEYAGYIKVTDGDDVIGIYSDAMEPEDATFCRDLSWIKSVIQGAYNLGVSNGRNYK